MRRLQILLLACSFFAAVAAYGQFSSPRSAMAFEEDTHYYITAWLADLLCFDWTEAHLIASGNISQDTDGKMKAHTKLLGFVYGNTMANWHAFGEATPVLARLGVLNARWLATWNLGGADETKGLVELGQTLHFAQDRFSHAGYGFILGHAVDTVRGSDPDSLAKDIPQSKAMIKDTLDLLDDACVAIGRVPNPTAAQIWAQQGFQKNVTQLINNSQANWRSLVSSIGGFFRRLAGRPTKYADVIANNTALVENKAGKTFPTPIRFDHDPTSGDPIITPPIEGAANLKLSLVSEEVIPPKLPKPTPPDDSYYYSTVRVENIGDTLSPAGALQVFAFVSPSESPFQTQFKPFSELAPDSFVDIELDAIFLSRAQDTRILIEAVHEDLEGLDQDARDNTLIVELGSAAFAAVGAVDLLVTVVTADEAAQIPIPGFYFHCRSDIQKAVNVLTARLYCYVDALGVDVNPEADPGITGDGFSGSPPPEPYGDVDERHTELTGIYDDATGTFTLSGCFEDVDGQSPLGNVYWELLATAGKLTGEVDIWILQPLGDCTGDAPTGLPTVEKALVKLSKLSDGKSDDADNDGVPTSRELMDETKCGRRDPYNKNDYYDVSIPRDGVIDLPNDILGVILHFAPGGYAAGDENWDRPPVMAGAGLGSTWNRGSPDGVIDLPNDILGVILQFNPAGCPALS